jgi:hypothetical protein
MAHEAIISERKFQKLVEKRTSRLLRTAHYLTQQQSIQRVMARPVLGELLSQSTQVEELLDAYGARGNQRWLKYRSIIATIKQFSQVGYELLHILHALPSYRLLPIGHDFARATNQTADFTGGVLLKAAQEITDYSDQLGLTIRPEELDDEAYSEELPTGRLPQDKAASAGDLAQRTITLLATAFLNLAAESRALQPGEGSSEKPTTESTPDYPTEESLRRLELRFHNLQSLYDTYVLGTETENLDKDLPILRGHISVILHLLRIATGFSHYYERHIKSQRSNIKEQEDPLVKGDMLLSVLRDYSVLYASEYLACAEHLCQEMLKRYAEIGQIEAPVPPYRGFHVRPATLISKLVIHYGSEVQMELQGQHYDAGSALELFRANEMINAQKRRSLADKILCLRLVSSTAPFEDIKQIVRRIVVKLAEQGALIMYEQPLSLSDEPVDKEGTVTEQVIFEINRLLLAGKIDVDSGLRAKFIGDKRVLADIELLAESGYGEDSFGNNIALPDKLKYLRK